MKSEGTVISSNDDDDAIIFLLFSILWLLIRHTFSVHWDFILIQTTAASSSTNKNYQASQSSSKQAQQQLLPGNYRSSMSSHSDIFMKADEQKINFGKYVCRISHAYFSIWFGIGNQMEWKGEREMSLNWMVWLIPIFHSNRSVGYGLYESVVRNTTNFTRQR